jgi:hypothetical protein
VLCCAVHTHLLELLLLFLLLSQLLQSILHSKETEEDNISPASENPNKPLLILWRFTPTSLQLKQLWFALIPRSHL